MDVQTSNGHAIILKYVASYVSKAHESFHNDALYSKDLNASTAAFRYAIALDMCEPEMWVLLSSKKISWTDATRKKFTVPTSDKAETNIILRKY